MLEIRRARDEEIPAIMKFIDEHWKKDHILARDREFFEWQFVEDDHVNVIIAIDDGTIYGLEGFVVYNESETPDISAFMWKTIKSPYPGLGMCFEDKLQEETNFRYAHTMGLSERAQKIYRIQGIPIENADHYYRLNNLETYKIAVVNAYNAPNVEKTLYKLVKVCSIEELQLNYPMEIFEEHPLAKSYRYINHRYFCHPIYHYDCWGIQYDGCGVGVVFTREENVENAKCLKIIDYYGSDEAFASVGAEFDRLLREYNYEFVDIYSVGFSKKALTEAGFISDRSNIIPAYFHPFCQNNTEIICASPILIPGLRTFLGDSDQDRPN